jgi:hypothetical protein
MSKKIFIKLILIIFLIFTIIKGQNFKFNEIYFSNINENFPDFIELFNDTDQPVSLLGYTLMINNNKDTLIANNNQYIVPPESYAIIFSMQGAVKYTEEKFRRQFPGNTIFLTYMKNNFNFFRNVENELVLFDEYGKIADSHKLSLITKPEFSKEYNNISGRWAESKTRFGTPGKINSLLAESVDLAIAIQPLHTKEKLQQTLPLGISNLGLNIAKNAQLKIAIDENLNNDIENNEIIHQSSLTINPSDSITREIACNFPAPGLYSLLAEIESDEDDIPANNQQNIIVKIPFAKSTLLINEFMYNTDHEEWVELYNNSEADINLKYWLIGDARNEYVITSQDVLLAPKSYIVIGQAPISLSNWSEDANFILSEEGWPALNNSGDSIRIVDPTMNTTDSLYYTSSWGSEKNVTLEKIDPQCESNDTDNWGLSIHESGGTPGFINSIILKDFDLSFLADSSYFLESKIFPGDSAHLLVTIKNNGRSASKDFSLKIFQSPFDTLFNEPLFTKNFEAVARNHTVSDTLAIPVQKSGLNYIKLQIDYPEDENQKNNRLIKILPVGFFPKSLVINEIMYYPEGDKPEWFEIANRSDSIVNIKDWLFRDSQNTIHKITENSVSIPPDSFAVVTGDENFSYYYENFSGILLQSLSFPMLNNSEDSLILLDPVENYIDSLGYSSEWGYKKGVSLERKSTEEKSNSFINWELSKSEYGATPGFTNSIALKDFDLALDTLYLKTNDILHGEDAILVLHVINNGEKSITNFDLSLNVYEDVAKEVVISEKYISVNKLISAGYFTRYEIELPNISGGVHPVVAKIYALKDNLVANNTFETNIEIGYSANSIIVNEIMYSPASGEAEWLEIYNGSNHKIDLNGWQFTDLSSKTFSLTDTLYYLQPEKFLVIASNEEFYESFPNCRENIIIPASFPTLNNTSDAVTLFDAINHKIDSVYYMKNWGGGSGISAERRNPYVPAISRENWGSCEDSLGGTPGETNSILKFDYDLAAVTAGFTFDTPETTPHTKNAFYIAVRNNGIYESGPYAIKIYNDSNFDHYTEEEEMVWSLSNIPSLAVDSTAVIRGKLFSENSGRTTYIAKIISNSEENPDDNIIAAQLKIEFEPGALVLNEFLAAPEKGQTEFLECLNNTDNDIILQGWVLSNEWHNAIIDFPTKIPSGQYALFAADSSIFEYYPPISCPIFILEDWPGMNNTQDQIVLHDLTGKKIDSLQYNQNWNVEYGKSLEKIMPAYHSPDSASWRLSTAELGATPGKFNSISPYVYDLKISDLHLSQNSGNTETLFEIKFFLENIGREISNDAKLQLFDMKFNSKTLYRTLKIKNIDAGSQDTLSMQLANLDKGYHKFLAQIAWQKDQNMDNDTINFEINIGFEIQDIYISEFMAHPKSVKSRGASISEYVELYNPLNRSIRIHDWKISDINTAENYSIISQKSIPAESYFVIASDSTIFNFPDVNHNNTVVLDKIPSFNNDEDMIVIFDATGVVIDSIVYNSAWEIEQGTSKEKIFMENENTPNNWRSSTSPQGGTPGIVNSVVLGEKIAKTGLQTRPNPFTPNGDGIDDEVGLHYQLSYPSAYIRIDIYDLTGRLIASPVENLRTGSQGVVYWDGTNKYGEKTRVGLYIARITATDANSQKTEGFIATFALSK